MNNTPPVFFALLIVWIVLGLLMIKGNDKCCPRDQRDYVHGDMVGCNVEEHKCGYNADVARPAFAAIGLLITIGVVCTAFGNKTDDEKRDNDEQQPILHVQPVSPTSTTNSLRVGAQVTILLNKWISVVSGLFEYEHEVKAGEIGKVVYISSHNLQVEFPAYKAWFNMTDKDKLFHVAQ